VADGKDERQLERLCPPPAPVRSDHRACLLGVTGIQACACRAIIGQGLPAAPGAQGTGTGLDGARRPWRAPMPQGQWTTKNAPPSPRPGGKRVGGARTPQGRRGQLYGAAARRGNLGAAAAAAAAVRGPPQ
jgi:hypothetical protein